ncbi:MAG: hypothetical protein AAB884_01215, partial [Patescibacteria group bacterium]
SETPNYSFAAPGRDFEIDFTFFTYANNQGTWPGFVAKLNNTNLFGDINLAEVQKEISSHFEQSTSLTNLFLVDPGKPGSWQSGNVSGVANRYLSFSQSGASLNYGWIGNVLVISASYDGFKEVVRRLQ